MKFNYADALLAGGEFPAATDPELKSAADIMRQVFTKFQGRATRAAVARGNGAMITMHWRPAGLGAGILQWQNGIYHPAVSVICSGLDPTADDAALTDGKVDVPDFAPHMIIQSPSPSMTTFYFDDQTINILGICALAIGFGQAFYSQLRDPLDR